MGMRSVKKLKIWLIAVWKPQPDEDGIGFGVFPGRKA